MVACLFSAGGRETVGWEVGTWLVSETFLGSYPIPRGGGVMFILYAKERRWMWGGVQVGRGLKFSVCFVWNIVDVIGVV